MAARPHGGVVNQADRDRVPARALDSPPARAMLPAGVQPARASSRLTVSGMSIRGEGVAIPSTPSTRPLHRTASTTWSIVAMAAYALGQWLLVVVLARLGSPEDVGIFALAL